MSPSKQHSRYDPSRRNRNIGTAKQGHGQDNRLVVPRRYQDCRLTWRRPVPHTVVTRHVWGRDLPFVVEHTRSDSWHACTPDDVTAVLNLLPKRHVNSFRSVNGIQGIVLRQPTRKEQALMPVWGRMGYSVNVGPIRGPVIWLDAMCLPLRLNYPRRLRPEEERELTRLKEAASQTSFDGRCHVLEFTLAAVRAVQLYHTLPHEVGHWADAFEHVEFPALEADDSGKWLALWDRYDQRPVVEREEFAHNYADRFRADQQATGAIPFERKVDAAALRAEGLRPADFLEDASPERPARRVTRPKPRAQRDPVEILPRVGCGRFRLGMRRDEVLERFGTPEFEEGSDGDSEHWYYDGGAIDLTFSADEDWRLDCLEVSKPWYTLRGEQLIGLEREVFLKKVATLGIGPVEEDDAYDDLEWMDSDTSSLTFRLEDGVLRAIVVYPEYEEDGNTVRWPELS